MDFFDSIFVPFSLLQVFAFSPFSLTNRQMKSITKNTHRNFSFAVMLTQLLVTILSLVFVNHIIFWALPQTIKTLDTITMTLIHLSAFLIFLESYKTRYIQMDFLRKINSIDFILEYKIGISPDYVSTRKTNIWRLIRWIVFDIVVFLTILIIFVIAYPTAYRWWLVCYPSFFICSLRYYQITTYVDIIHHRYQRINQFIENFSVQSENDILKDERINVELAKTIHVRTLIQKYQTGRLYDKLFDLRRVCRLLNSANNAINEMFLWSIPLIIVNDFLHILINSYWTLRIFLKNGAFFHMIPPSLWTFSNFNHVISLAAVCHHATDEVIFNGKIIHLNIYN